MLCQWIVVVAPDALEFISHQHFNYGVFRPVDRTILEQLAFCYSERGESYGRSLKVAIYRECLIFENRMELIYASI